MLIYGHVNESILSNMFIDAAKYIGKKVYSKPYTNYKNSLMRANFHYTCTDNTVINRPNHTLLHALRTTYYINPVIEYFKNNGSEEIQNLMNLVSKDEIEKIKYLLLFYASGRENEVGISTNKALYAKFRRNAKANFIEYFNQQKNLIPFTSKKEVEHYANMLTQYDLEGLDDKNKIIVLLLRACHTLDLLRCSKDNIFKRNINNTFNRYSTYRNTKNLQSLIYYAQHCIINTGDKLRTKYEEQNIHGVHSYQTFNVLLRKTPTKLIRTGNNSFVFGAKEYNEELFSRYCKVDEESIKQTLSCLSGVKRPILYKSNDVDSRPKAYSAARAIQVIKDGNGIIRSSDVNPLNISLRFEIEQLINPKYIRPIREKKLRLNHTNYYDIKEKKFVKRPEKQYIPIEKQPLKDKPLPPLKYASNKPISKQEDRGKPKNTIFTKKKSYSLLPSSGRYSHFMGKLYNRLFKDFIPVGTLYNLEEMDLKGERFIWNSDVRSSGIAGYFWLSRKIGKRHETKKFVGLNHKRYKENLTVKQLKEKLKKTKNKPHFNELLLSASLKSLEAIYANKDSRFHRLAAFYLSNTLAIDYGVIRPMLIIDGHSAPKEYTKQHAKNDLFQAIKTHKKWYWRLWRYIFSPDQEYLLLMSIIKPFSSKGLDVDKKDINIEFARKAKKTKSSYHSISNNLKIEDQECEIVEKDKELIFQSSTSSSPEFYERKNDIEESSSPYCILSSTSSVTNSLRNTP